VLQNTQQFGLHWFWHFFSNALPYVIIEAIAWSWLNVTLFQKESVTFLVIVSSMLEIRCLIILSLLQLYLALSTDLSNLIFLCCSAVFNLLSYMYFRAPVSAVLYTAFVSCCHIRCTVIISDDKCYVTFYFLCHKYIWFGLIIIICYEQLRRWKGSGLDNLLRKCFPALEFPQKRPSSFAR